jgi:hypothetical protein
MTFRYGSADPCLWLMDPDPAIFIIFLQTPTINFFSKFFLTVIKKSQNSRNRCFSNYFCLMIDPDLWLLDPDPGGPKTYGSYGSGFVSESVATLPPFGPIEGLKWFDRISSQWESQKNRFALIYFGKIRFLPPCIWNIPFMSYSLWICHTAFKMCTILNFLESCTS